MENTTTREIPTTTVTQHLFDSEVQPSSSSNNLASSSPSLSNPSSSEAPSESASQTQLADESNPSDEGSMEARQRHSNKRLKRPKLGSRKSSGSIIVPREAPVIEVQDEEYDPDDARAMSPRRSSGEIERMEDDARQALEQQALALQSNLSEIIERVQSVKQEHEKLEGGNKFLQSYIGELMQTSKIASSGAPKTKKGRGNK